MALAPGGFGHNLLIGPAQLSEMNGKRHAREPGRCRRTEPFADRNFVLHEDSKRKRFAAVLFHHLAIGFDH